MNVQTQTNVVNDPAGVCMLLLAHGMPLLAAHTARQWLRAHGVYAPAPGQAKAVRAAWRQERGDDRG